MTVASDTTEPASTLPALAPRPAPPGRRGTRLHRYLGQSVQLEECGPPGLARATILALTFLVGAAVAWAAMTDIQEVAVAPGQVLPSGSLQVVQHLEGGIVAEVAVKDGDRVAAGQVLMRLDRTSPAAELGQLRARQIGLQLQGERLRAFAEDRKPRFGGAGDSFPDLVREQMQALRGQIDARERQRDVLKAQVAERRRELAALANTRRIQESQVELLAEEFRMRDTLLKQGLISKILHLDTQRRLNQARGDLEATRDRAEQTKEQIGEARARLAELDARLRSDAQTELGRVGAELAEVESLLQRADDRVARLEVTAPVGGIVKGLKVPRVGAVVAPGGVLMEIVPLDEEMVAEIRIAPNDIGHVSLGQPALIKVATFDFARMGGIEGELAHISATTFETEKGETYYRGIVHLARNHVGANPARNIVLPGMTVIADIRTGTRTVFEYLIKPVRRSLDQALGER